MKNPANLPLRDLHWPLVLGLGALALVRPLARIVADPAGTAAAPALSVTISILVSVVWVAVVGWTNVTHPVLTLVCAGVAYGLLSIVLAAVLSPVLSGAVQGPLTRPFTIVPVLLVNAFWGLLTGLVALLVRRARARAAR